MAALKTKDITFRLSESTGQPAIATDTEHVIGVIKRLLEMKPGSDIYNPGMGIDIRSYNLMAARNGSRLPALETDITNQLIQYTDVVPKSLVAMALGGRIYLSGTISYGGIDLSMTIAQTEDGSLNGQIVRR